MGPDDIRAAVREALRDELPRILAELLPGAAALPDDLLDVPAAAQRLGIGRSTIRKLAGKCELASVKSGRRLLFKPKDLDAYAEARRRSPERVRELASR